MDLFNRGASSEERVPEQIRTSPARFAKLSHQAASISMSQNTTVSLAERAATRSWRISLIQATTQNLLCMDAMVGGGERPKREQLSRFSTPPSWRHAGIVTRTGLRILLISSPLSSVARCHIKLSADFTLAVRHQACPLHREIETRHLIFQLSPLHRALTKYQFSREPRTSIISGC
jgi:hypothetical protein